MLAIPVLGGQRQVGLWGSLISQPRLLSEFQASEWTCLKKVALFEEWHPVVSSGLHSHMHIYVHTQVHVSACTWTHIHLCTNIQTLRDETWDPGNNTDDTVRHCTCSWKILAKGAQSVSLMNRTTSVTVHSRGLLSRINLSSSSCFVSCRERGRGLSLPTAGSASSF